MTGVRKSESNKHCDDLPNSVKDAEYSRWLDDPRSTPEALSLKTRFVAQATVVKQERVGDYDYG